MRLQYNGFPHPWRSGAKLSTIDAGSEVRIASQTIFIEEQYLDAGSEAWRDEARGLGRAFLCSGCGARACQKPPSRE
jgi:hypothetical protein